MQSKHECNGDENENCAVFLTSASILDLLAVLTSKLLRGIKSDHGFQKINQVPQAEQIYLLRIA